VLPLTSLGQKGGGAKSFLRRSQNFKLCPTHFPWGGKHPCAPLVTGLEISAALYVAVEVDETTDVTNKAQTSVILRYVAKSEVVCEVKEAF